MELHVVYASDDNYSPYMGVSIYSLLVNNASDFEKIRIYILDNGISVSNHRILSQQAEGFGNAVISFHDISNQIAQIKPKCETGWPNSIFGRFFIDDFVDAGVDRLLYLDCDTVVNASLRELMDTDTEGYQAAGVIDGLADERKEALGISGDWLYVNSGMLLVNVIKWKEDKICSRLVEYVNSFEGRLVYPDQDVFNAVCGNRILRLPLKYNFYQTMDFHYIDTYLQKDNPPYSRSEMLEAMANDCAGVVVFHFTGNKPWNKSESCERFERVFTRYSMQSPWRIKPKFRNVYVFLEHYRIKLVVGLYDFVRKIVGDKFYNIVKNRFNG